MTVGFPTSIDEAPRRRSVFISSPTKFPALWSVVDAVPLTDGRRFLASQSLSPSSLLPSRILSIYRPAPTTLTNTALKLVSFHLITDDPQDQLTHSLPHRLPPHAKGNNTLQWPHRLTLMHIRPHRLYGGITHRQFLATQAYKHYMHSHTGFPGGITHRQFSPTAYIGENNHTAGSLRPVLRLPHSVVCRYYPRAASPFGASTRRTLTPSFDGPLNFKFWLGVQNTSAPAHDGAVFSNAPSPTSRPTSGHYPTPTLSIALHFGSLTVPSSPASSRTHLSASIYD
eukprot:Gb_29352 [translate_table: standard]